MTWIVYFLLALSLSLAITGGIVFFKIKTSKNKKRFFRLGGVGIILAFLFSVLFIPELEITMQLKGLMLGSMIILMFGVWDDFKNFSWKPQLAFQFLLILILILSGFSIFYLSSPTGDMIRTDLNLFQLFEQSFSLISIILISFWVLAIINAVSWSDGVDGLTGGIAILGGLALFLISLQPEVNQPAVAILAIVFLGATLGFWFFNLPFAKIEAGTSGSYFIGFFLASSAIIAGTKMATAMIVLAIPLVDFFWVIIERMKAGEPITRKDKRHLHYKLRRLGWSDGKIVLVYILFIGAVLLLSNLVDLRWLKFSLLAVEMVIVLIFISWVTRKNINLKNETKNKR